MYYLSKISFSDKSYLDVSRLFRNYENELYMFKVDTHQEDGLVIRDAVGRSMPVAWQDVSEFSAMFNHFNNLSEIINVNNYKGR